MHVMSFMYILYNMKDSSPKKAKLHDTLTCSILDRLPRRGETVGNAQKRDSRSHRFALDQEQNIVEITGTGLR